MSVLLLFWAVTCRLVYEIIGIDVYPEIVEKIEIWMLVDAMFIHIDAQGRLVFIVVPLWQSGALLAVTLTVYSLNKVKK